MNSPKTNCLRRELRPKTNSPKTNCPRRQIPPIPTRISQKTNSEGTSLSPTSWEKSINTSKPYIHVICESSFFWQTIGTLFFPWWVFVLAKHGYNIFCVWFYNFQGLQIWSITGPYGIPTPKRLIFAPVLPPFVSWEFETFS